MTTYEGEAIAACQRWMDRCKQAEAKIERIMAWARNNECHTCKSGGGISDCYYGPVSIDGFNEGPCEHWLPAWEVKE